MIVGIILANVLLVAVLASVVLLIRDVRKLHRGGKSLTGSPIDASGVSPAAMTYYNNLGSH